ncbi:MAG: M23 family metallopeptidase [Balneolaceae bacterium]|nr:M23 family metallopeptidase [Balneolaceae bacterium]
MIEFLKKIFASKERELTFMLFDDNEPESSTTFQFKPEKLLYLLYGSIAATVIVVLLIVMFTPLGTLVYNQEDEELRQSVIEIQQKVAALKDSLNARDVQLSEIQNVISGGTDTTFAVRQGTGGDYISSGSGSFLEPQTFSTVNREATISKNEIIFSSLFKNDSEFPVFYPVDGSLTRGFDLETGHYGIDIATKKNASFKSIAEGAVVNQDWTVNFGYVLHVQHNNGIISVYKHASSVTKSVGDVVLKGDILGTVGDVGVLSSGPHLHLEIWKNGVPQDPKSYLIKS